MSADARIARLRVATDPGVCQGLAVARMLIEDALRTEASAAGPGAMRGLLALRRLDAGRAREKSDRRAVQRRVGEALAEAGRYARHPLDIRASEAEAVLFENPLQPYTLYAEALFRRSMLRDAWFFRAIFGRRKDGDLMAAGRTLLVRAANEPFGPHAIAEVIDRADLQAPALLSSMSRGEAAPVLAVLLKAGDVRPSAWATSADVSMAHSLLPSSTPTVDEAVHGPTPELPRYLPRALLAAAALMIRRLGTNDPRVQLLVAAMLIKASNRAVSAGLVGAVTRVMAEREAPLDPVREEPVRKPGITQDVAVPAVAEAPASPKLGLPLREPPERPSSRDREIFEAHPDAVAETPRSAPGSTQDPVSADWLPEPSAGTGKSSPGRSRAPSAGERGGFDGAKTRRKAHEPGGGSPDADERDDDPPPSPLSSPELPCGSPFGQTTAWAGAVLVVTVVHRLLGQLVTSPEALDLDLGPAVLERMLRRAGCSDDDAMLKALGRPARSSSPLRPSRFDLPAAFDVFGADGLALHRIDGHQGWRALTCRGGRIILAMWQTRAALPIRRRIGDLLIRRGQPLAADLTSAVLRSAELTIRAANRRLTDYPIREVLARSGWVRSTRSHLDVTFDAALVDLRVRRAGLDLDPGWCAWLFRVVTIHYDYGASQGWGLSDG